jgi:hypothetical protein
MSEAVEHAEHIEHAGQHNKGIALLISVLALFLALSETLGKSSQTAALTYNVQSSDTWAFYQARNIRMTTVGTAQEVMQLELDGITDPAKKAKAEKLIDTWKKRIALWDSEPEKGEGRKELMAKARNLEKQRDLAMERYENYEIASAALQIGIVLASASVITSMIALAWLAGGVGVVGLALMAMGLWWPTLLMQLISGGHGGGH